jgi:AmmeMemoRadiSam system protein B
VYSGPIAASAYARIRAARDGIRTVVALGPSHRVPFRGLAASAAAAFVTPLGEVAVDRAGVEAVLALPQVQILEAAHAQEHSLEVQLPFLQETLGPFTWIPLVTGDASADEVAEVLETVWGGPETLILVSSDLSHYHDYASARSLDLATTTAIENLRYEELHGERACGYVGIRGLLAIARRRGLRVETLDLRTSGDTAGPRDAVVGYGAYAFA